MESLEGKVGFMRPTFEEYPNRYDPAKSIIYVPDDADFRYGVDDLIGFFGDKGLEALVLINPDNPTGNYIPKADVERMMSWAEETGVRLVYDESFSDFADERDNTFIVDALLEQYPHAVVMKSVSKSFGVPGARLGVMCSADAAVIERAKKDVGIWNINSFGEFYLQIAEKYRNDYDAALELLREDRGRLTKGLSRIAGVRVLPSQANYLMVELTGANATEVAQRLLCDHGLLVKDLSGKTDRNGRQFLRIAVRDERDNAKLVEVLQNVMES